MQFNHCRLEIDGHVATLVMDHPEVMNAVSTEMLAGLSEALDAVTEKRGEIRCLGLLDSLFG